MARIRQIKPEYWSSLTIAKLPRLTRLHFVALWNYVDDEGRGIDDARLIKAACFPLDDDVDVAEIERHQAELALQGRIVRYQADDGRRYLAVVNFVEHQYVQKRQTSKLPAPDGAHPERSGRPPVAGTDERPADTAQPPQRPQESPPDQQVQSPTESLPPSSGSTTVEVPPGLGVGGRGQVLGSGVELRRLGVRPNPGHARETAHDDEDPPPGPQPNPAARVLTAVHTTTGTPLHSRPAQQVRRAVAQLTPTEVDALVAAVPTLCHGTRGAPQLAELVAGWCHDPASRNGHRAEPTPPYHRPWVSDGMLDGTPRGETT